MSKDAKKCALRLCSLATLRETPSKSITKQAKVPGMIFAHSEKQVQAK